MNVEWLIALSVILVGLGTVAALFRRNIFAVALNFCTALLGMILLLTSLGGEGVFFAFCLIVVLVVVFVLAVVAAYRRFLAVGVVNVNEKNELEH